MYFCTQILMYVLMYVILAQATETLVTAESLLGDLGGFASFKQEATSLQEELKEYQHDQFDGWSRDMLAAIDDPQQSIRYSYYITVTI